MAVRPLAGRLPAHRHRHRTGDRPAGRQARGPVVRGDPGVFLGLQGVMLAIIGEGGTIPYRNEVVARAQQQEPCRSGSAGRWRRGVPGRVRRPDAGAPSAAAARAASPGSRCCCGHSRPWAWPCIAIAVVGYLSSERSRQPHPDLAQGRAHRARPDHRAGRGARPSCSTRTAWGRHIYAVGGNAEAARRAGINVALIKISCFMMCSTIAAFAGLLLASRDQLGVAQHRRRRDAAVRRRRGRHRRHQPLRRQGPRSWTP